MTMWSPAQNDIVRGRYLGFDIVAKRNNNSALGHVILLGHFSDTGAIRGDIELNKRSEWKTWDAQKTDD